MTKPLYFYNGSSFEQVGPTTPQSPIAYQTSEPTGPATGDLWIDSDGDVDTYNRQLTRYYFVATAAQTTITGTDANGLTLAYVAGSEAVYVNGALQVRGQDYTATDGTSVVLTAALAVNDVVEIFAYTAFTVANAYTKSETDGVAAAAPGLRLIVPTSVSVGSGSGSVSAVGTVTFSGASSVSLNDVFSSTYDRYKILVDGNTSLTSAVSILMRLRVSGSDNTSSNYRWTSIYLRDNSAAPTVSGEGSNGTNTFAVAGSLSSTAGFTAINTIELANPFATKNTALTNINYVYDQSGPLGYVYTGGAIMTVTTSYTGFTLYTSSGTMTGTIQVYGYKD